jgi:uncharacterized protein with ATP-grasp and redox domains
MKSNIDLKPLCGNDGGFTRVSIVKRLPDILDTVIEHNKDNLNINQLNAFNTIRNELSQGTITSITLHEDTRDDDNIEFLEWKRYEQEFDVKKKTWLELPWFFVENYFYKLILDVMEYRKNGIDPFEKQKIESLTQPIESGAVSAIAHTIDKQLKDKNLDTKSLLNYLIAIDLWGNKADLSFSGGAASSNEEIQEHKDSHELRTEYILANDADVTVTSIQQEPKKYNFIVDNCGLEIVSDLFFGHCLLEKFNAQQVTFYVKTEPVFVSDVMTKDFYYTIEQLCSASDEITAQYGKLFKQHLEQKKWVVKEHRFFTGPLPYYELSSDLEQQIAESGSLTIVKGDANYRRLFNDRNYEIDTEFEHLVDYFPTDLVALRTLKSDCVVGLKHAVESGKVAQLNQKESDWRVNGKYGVISFAHIRAK